MLRRKRFTRLEIILLCFFAAVLLVAGVSGIFLAAKTAHWRLALVSFGVLGLATVYFLAAKRGMPL